MEPERWQRIVDITEAAAELAGDERDAFLGEACAGDGALRTEVESLLESDERSGGFIETSGFRIAAELIAGDPAGSMVGQDIGAYKIVDLLGVGGMGEVYLAEDTRLGRKVALKFLPDYFTSDKTRVRRFEQEARAASALNHPNILTVYEIGESDGTQFIATEFVEGKTLRQHIEGGQTTLAQVLDVAIQVARALEIAHQAGIVHRDIKPENIMLRPDGYIKVLDFGLAKMTGEQRLRDSDGHTGAAITSDTGPVMGTPYYMSPEQARGLKVDGRTDIFSLGVVIYEMLTGCKPFDGETPSHVIVAILEKDPHRVSEISPGLPSGLNEIVTRALRKDRLDRYQTAGDLITDLKNIKQRLELDAQPALDFGKRGPVFASGDLLRGDLLRDDAAVGPSDTNRKALGAKHVISQIWRRRRRLALGALAIAAAAASIIYFSSFDRAKAIDSVAILPFTSAAADPDVQYMADGIADDLTDRLSRLPALTVISNRAASRYKAADPQAAGPDIRAIGRELNVQAVVSGSVVQHGDRVYVSVELIDARNNRHLWGQHYDRKPADIFGMQDEIAHGISETLRVNWTGPRSALAAKRQTESTEAYQAYLKGRYFWNQRTEDGLHKAISFFDQARGIDPDYALAYAGLADSYQLLAFHGGLSPKDYYPSARAAAERAVTIDDDLAEAHTALAYVKFLYDWDWAGAEVEFRRAIEINPNYATAHQWYGEFLGRLGRIDESLAERKVALTLDPLSPIIRSELGYSYVEARQYDRAVEEFRNATELYPDFSPAHCFLSLAYQYSGLYDEALAECRRAIDLGKSDHFLLLQLAHILAISGKRAESRQLLAEITNEPKNRYFPPTHIATVYVALGDKERAFEWLEKAYKERDWGLVGIRVYPEFDAVRSDPRFADLLQRMNLQ
jgi:serine/threonine-protein kinase